MYCSDNVSDDDLNMLEISFIERYNPRFNFTKGGDGIKGYKHSDETKQKMSENHAKYWEGKNFSNEHKQKIGEENKGNYFEMRQSTKFKLSKTTNTTSFYNVSKKKDNKYKQGYVFVYRYYKNKKRHFIYSTNLNKLKYKVLSKNLIWRKL